MNTDNGRSMIEMLGVLAIIGVLSVGGLFGYSKAIERYRVNETINQITHIVTNTRTLFKTQRDFYSQLGFNPGKNMSDETNEIRAIVERAKLFPEAIIKSGYKNMFGGDIRYYASGKFASNDGKAFVLNIFNIPQEACIEILTRDWQSSLGIVMIRVRGSASSVAGPNNIYSDSCTTEYTAGGGVFCANDIPLTVEQAVAVCDTENSNQFAWKFY
jgi:type II secretory pathway pseudopilin PulG